MIVRRASEKDYPGIVSLQERNIRENLSLEQRKDGFLSVRFSQQQFADMNADGLVVVCEDHSYIAGYTCASTPSFNREFEVPNQMMAALTNIEHQQHKLSDYRYVVTGPSCIDVHYRGKGIYAALKRRMIELLPAEIEMLITFVSGDNKRSSQAISRQGYRRVGFFMCDNRQFRIYCKPVA